MICDLTFETIMANAKEFVHAFRFNFELASRLKMPLKQTKIIGQVDQKLQVQESQKKMPKVTGADYRPGWMIADELESNLNKNKGNLLFLNKFTLHYI
jgi:hypothetical protein